MFDRAGKFRAIAGGGRYDNLISQLSDGTLSLPALGFAMGDVVLGELINEIPRAREAMQKAIANDSKIDIYVVIAKEQRRADALAQIQQLRDRGYRIDYPLTPTKVARQFQAAEDLGARVALLYGDEWPQVKIKNMGTGEQELVAPDRLLAHLQAQSTLVILSGAQRSRRIPPRNVRIRNGDASSPTRNDRKHVSHTRLQFTSQKRYRQASHACRMGERHPRSRRRDFH